MKTTPAQIDAWRKVRSEDQVLEFKEAKKQFDNQKLFRYCVAIANEGGGHLLLGIQDKPPRNVVGSKACDDPVAMASKLFRTLGFRVDIEEVSHPDGRVVVFHIPSRPRGTACHLDGTFLMRSGEELVAMSPDQLRKIFSEGQPDWLDEVAKHDARPDEVVALLDTQTFFDLMGVPYPSTREGVIDRLSSEGLIAETSGGWNIFNLAAILLAKRLDAFDHALARKAVRFVVYDGNNKLKTKTETTGARGYAVGFAGLVEFVYDAAPQNEYVEVAIREEVKMFPYQAIRELIANALVHQDFACSGASIMIEMYADRLEISNPGTPTIPTDRFIDEYRSRNERLADLMRRLGICEEKGSGVDKVVSAAEFYQLPAPDFRESEIRTTAVLYSHQDFASMSKSDRIRACYQHCVLQYLSGTRMSNQSLRQRFGLDDSPSNSAIASQVITSTKEEGLIKADSTETTSTRYARYIPVWG